MGKTYKVTAWRADSESQIAKLNILDLNSEHMAEVMSVTQLDKKWTITISFLFADEFIKSMLNLSSGGFVIFICPQDIPSNSGEVQIHIKGEKTSVVGTLYDMKNNIYNDGITKGRMCVIKFSKKCYLLNV